MKGNFSIDSDTGPRSFNAFERAWNTDVANRFKAWSSGEDNVVLIRLKSRQLLIGYFKENKEHASFLQATAPTEDDAHREHLNDTLRHGRQNLPAATEPHQCQNVSYGTEL